METGILTLSPGLNQDTLQVDLWRQLYRPAEGIANNGLFRRPGSWIELSHF